MRVLITGHRGYFGSVLTGVLRRSRFEVAGMDIDLYRDCDFGRVREEVPSFDIDIRDVEFTDLLPFDAVVHLISLPESASDYVDDGQWREINIEATARLARCCRKASVSRFVLASSCGVYEGSNGCVVNEQTPVDPLSLHANAKLECERELLSSADAAFTPVVLRHATIYGVSPRLRLDTMVNEAVASATATQAVTLRGDARAWRPLVHVEDLARMYAAVLTAPDETVHAQVFNAVAPDQNYRIVDVADIVTELVPSVRRLPAELETADTGYRADATKWLRTFPRFCFRWRLEQGVCQLRDAMIGAGLTPGDLRSDRFRRGLRLQRVLSGRRPRHTARTRQALTA